MAKRIQILGIILMLVTSASLVSCGGSDEEGGGLFSLNATSERDFQPLDQYTYDDFNLAADPFYWETRLGAPQSAGIPLVLRYEVLFLYAQELLEDVFVDELEELSEITSAVGFANKCNAAYCPVYIAGINSAQGFFLITTSFELAAFFGDIDTPAELAYWLWVGGYTPQSYQEVDAGYEARVTREDRCGGVQELEVFVDFNGIVSILEANEDALAPDCPAGNDIDQVDPDLDPDGPDLGPINPDFGPNNPDFGQDTPDFGPNNPDFGPSDADVGQVNQSFGLN